MCTAAQRERRPDLSGEKCPGLLSESTWQHSSPVLDSACDRPFQVHELAATGQIQPALSA